MVDRENASYERILVICTVLTALEMSCLTGADLILQAGLFCKFILKLSKVAFNRKSITQTV